jgi:beta-glucosidase
VLTNNAFGVDKLTIPQRFAKAVKAGVSLFSDNNDPQGLLDAVHQGLLKEADLDSSVTLLLTEIFQLGLFENPYTDPESAARIVNSPSSTARADEAHRKSIVLLRNDTKLLPLTGARKIYVEVMASDGGGGARGGGGLRGGQRSGGRAGAAADATALNAPRGNAAGGRGEPVLNSSSATAAFKALLTKDPTVQLVDSWDKADVALLWLRPSVFQRPEHDYADIALSPLTGIDVAKVRQIETATPTVLVINFINPWVINEVEPGAAALVATFDVKADALLDVVRGRFNPGGKLPLTIPANQAAVDRNAPDVPGYAETFDYAYKNRVNDKYIFGFGLSYGR